ncbi:MAG: endonuclease/exonuclease/phosphatase family protein [Sulfurovum sp.]|nr:endonuclease/exonuclease/phosphatase family protein [Sulfurovum sp.]
MRYLLLFFLPLFLISKPFKVATYNVENLFDAKFNGSEYEEYIPGKHNWNSRMVEIKLNHTAEVICDIDADILGLQEIENKHIFKQLIVKLKKVGCAYKYSAITNKKGAAIQVALLSRFPLHKQKDIQVSYSPRVRNILEVDIIVEDHPLRFFVNHWKSKAYKGYESKRIKYAKALQSRIARLSPSKEYIVIGDFNSDYNAYLTLDDKIDDTGGKTGFSDILKTKIEEHEILHAKQGWHYTLWKELAVDKRWSYKFYSKKSSLDQIVLPRHMFDTKGIDYVNDSFGVFKAKYLFTKRGYINNWRYKNGKHMAKGYSDHLPVYAYFDTKPYKSYEKKYRKKSITSKMIEYLYKVESIDGQIELKNVVVIFKRGRNAIIKQSPSGRGVMLYGSASKLKEGYKYDLLVDAIKTYKGLKEVTSAYKLKEKGKVDVKMYMSKASNLGRLKQNEVVVDIVGMYKNRYLYIRDKKIPIYFKKRKLTPKNGSKLKIHYAHLGYYKKEQLVIYSKKDFTIME